MNATLGFEAWLRSWLYAYTSENHVAVRNRDGQLRILLKVQPSLSAFDLMIFKPKSDVFFRNVPLSETMNILFPLNAVSSLAERLIDSAVDDGLSRKSFSKKIASVSK